MTLDELDRLAAEKVMGWTFVRMHAQIDCWDDGTPNKIPRDCWQPTRNIAQAWECLEKHGTTAVINFIPGHGASCVVFSKLNENIEPISLQATTAPEAITRACLAARGVKIDKE